MRREHSIYDGVKIPREGVRDFKFEMDQIVKPKTMQYHNIKVPKGYMVCHTCDVKSCFNPFHLFIDTPKGNMEDRDRKGRQARGIRSGVSKLNEEQVIEIRLLYPLLNTVELGEKFNVHPSTIGIIVRRKTWKHLL